MKILLYNPDNGVTRNFMPHLWMFLLQSLTPPEHQIILVDGNTKAMNEAELVQFAREQEVGLVGIVAHTSERAKESTCGFTVVSTNRCIRVGELMRTDDVKPSQ